MIGFYGCCTIKFLGIKYIPIALNLIYNFHV
jgi:hypothetical protein